MQNFLKQIGTARSLKPIVFPSNMRIARSLGALVLVFTFSINMLAVPAPAVAAAPFVVVFLAEVAAGYLLSEFIDWIRGRDYGTLQRDAAQARAEYAKANERLQAVHSEIGALRGRQEKLESLEQQRAEAYADALGRVYGATDEFQAYIGLLQSLSQLDSLVKTDNVNELQSVYYGLRRFRHYDPEIAFANRVADSINELRTLSAELSDELDEVRRRQQEIRLQLDKQDESLALHQHQLSQQEDLLSQHRAQLDFLLRELDEILLALRSYPDVVADGNKVLVISKRDSSLENLLLENHLRACAAAYASAEELSIALTPPASRANVSHYLDYNVECFELSWGSGHRCDIVLDLRDGATEKPIGYRCRIFGIGKTKHHALDDLQGELSHTVDWDEYFTGRDCTKGG